MKIHHVVPVLIIGALILISCPPPTQNVPVTGVEVEPESLILEVGDSQALTVTILPTNASN